MNAKQRRVAKRAKARADKRQAEMDELIGRLWQLNGEWWDDHCADEDLFDVSKSYDNAAIPPEV